jgi:hypothetical protein
MSRITAMELSVNNAGILKALVGLTVLELGIIIIRRFPMSMINCSTKQEKPK